MAETPLSKVLRLAGGITKAYVHNVHGRPVQVRQYPTPHPAIPHASPPPVPRNAPPPPKTPAGMSAFGQLQKGMVVDIHNQDYRVSAVNVPFHAFTTGKTNPLTTGKSGLKTKGKKTGKKGGKGFKPAANTAAGAAAQAASMRFGTPSQDPTLAALNGKTIPKGAPTATNLLVNTANGFSWFVTLPVDMLLKVEAGAPAAKGGKK